MKNDEIKVVVPRFRGKLKISIKALALIVGIIIVTSLFTTIAVLTITKSVSNTVHIRGVNLSVTPSTLAWNDLIDGTPSTQSQQVTLNNTANEPLTIDFSDDLATQGITGITMTYPAEFELNAGAHTNVTLTMNYDGTTTYGDYGWNIVATGVDAPGAVTDLLATADTLLHSAAPTNNYGALTTANFGTFGGTIKGLVGGFNVPSSMNGKTIVSAKLILNYLGFQSNDPVGVSLGAYQVTSAWTEGTATYSGQPSVIATPVGTVACPAATATTITIDVTSAVQAWVNGGANYGFELQYVNPGSAPSSLVNFGTHEGGQPALLEITVASP